MTELRDSPETLGGTVTSGVLERLGRAGLDEAALGFLADVGHLLSPESEQSIKFAAGLLLIAETAESVKPSGKVEQVVDIRSVEAQLVPIQSTSESRLIPSSLVARSVPIERAKKTHEVQPAFINPQADKFLTHVFGSEIGSLPEGIIIDDVEQLGMDLLNRYFSTPNTGGGRRPSISKEERERELLLYVDNTPPKVIQEKIQSTRSKFQIEDFHKNVARKLRKDGFDGKSVRLQLEAIVAQRSDRLIEFPVDIDAVTPETVLTAPPVESAPEDIQVEPATTLTKEMLESEAEIKVAIQELCVPYWNSTDLLSLALVLSEDKLSDNSMAARAHLSGLLASYCPVRGDGEILDRVEWDTLSLISGYDVPNGEVIKAIPFAERLVQMKHHNDALRALPSIYSALQKLIKRAAPQYQEGWYPFAKSTDNPSAPIPAAIPRQAERKRDEVQIELQEVVQKIVRGMNFSSVHIEQICGHLGATGQIVITPKILQTALIAMRGRAQSAIKHSRSKQHYRSADVSARDFIMPQDEWILKYLLGDPDNGRHPRAFKELIADANGMRTIGATPEDIPQRITTALQKVARWA